MLRFYRFKRLSPHRDGLFYCPIFALTSPGPHSRTRIQKSRALGHVLLCCLGSFARLGTRPLTGLFTQNHGITIMATAKKAPTKKAPAQKPIKPAAGRGQPTLYRPEYCEKVIEWGREGKSKAQIASRLDICRQTLDNWTADHPEFLDAVTRARIHAQNWWEDKAQEGMLVPGFNASVWAKSMTARFPEDYTEKNKTELTGADGGPISHSIEVAFVGSKG